MFMQTTRFIRRLPIRLPWLLAVIYVIGGKPESALKHRQAFWGKTDFWAPDLYYYEGKYYMFATFSGADEVRGASVLVSDKPEGPFIPLVNRPVTPNGWQALDAALLLMKTRIRGLYSAMNGHKSPMELSLHRN